MEQHRLGRFKVCGSGPMLDGAMEFRFPGRQSEWAIFILRKRALPLSSDPFLLLHPRRQDRWGRADRNRLAPLLQGTACQAEVGGHLPLRLSRRQARAGRPKLLRPLQARAAPHDQPTIDDRAARSGIGLVSGL